MSGSEDSLLPPYTLHTAGTRSSRLNPTLRRATPGDAQTISAIHTYYATKTDAVLVDNGQDQLATQNSIYYVQVDCKLPYFVATVPLAQLSADERTRAESTVDSDATSATVNLLATSSRDALSNLPKTAPDLPLSKEESKAKERIVGYVVVQPHQPNSGLRAYWRTAECVVLVAPRYLGRGIGTDLMRSMIKSLESIIYVPPEARKLDLASSIKSSSPRWLELLAIVPVRKAQKNGDDPGERKMRHELDRQLEDQQRAIWTGFGFLEKGRLTDVAEMHGRTMDIWYFQRHLKPVKHNEIVGVKE